MQEINTPITASEEFLGYPELVLQERPDGSVTGVVMREMRSSFHVTFADGFAEPEEVEKGITILRHLHENGEYGSWKKEANVDAPSLDEAIASSRESSRGQKFVFLYRGNEWLWGIWNNPNKDSVLAGSFHLSSVADFHGTRVSKAKRASRRGLAAVRKNMKVAGDYAVLDASLSMLGSSVPGSKIQQDYEANGAVKALCDWWNAKAPEGMQEAGAFRVYSWNQVDMTFIAGDPEEPAMQANQAENLPSYALFDANADRPMVLLWFLRGRRFNTNDGGGTMIYSADGEPAYDIGLDLAEVDEAYYSLRGLEALRVDSRLLEP